MEVIRTLTDQHYFPMMVIFCLILIGICGQQIYISPLDMNLDRTADARLNEDVQNLKFSASYDFRTLVGRVLLVALICSQKGLLLVP